MQDILDEMRRERKILMVIKDLDVEEYITLDLSEALTADDTDFPPFMKRVVEEKRRFRAELCQLVSVLRLGYMYKMLRVVHPEKASMLGAEAFKVKVLKYERRQLSRKRRLQKGQMSAASASTNMISSSGSMADSDDKNRVYLFTNPILTTIHDYITTLRTRIGQAGQQKYQVLMHILQEARAGEGGRPPHDKLEEPLDTIETNLQHLEGKRKLQYRKSLTDV